MARRGTREPDIPAYRLVRPRLPQPRPVVLDAGQQSVVDHRGGPLLVLAGPGTGKTTTIVEAVVARIDEGLDPESVLVLTFGRKAAAELRQRISARLGRATREPLARTFHSYAFGVLRRDAAARGEPAPRLLTGPEQDVVVRELLRGDLAGGGGRSGWPERLHAALPTRGFAQELRDLMMRAYERGLAPEDLAALGARHGRDDWVAVARFLRQYFEVSSFRDRAAYAPAELIRDVVGLWQAEPEALERERNDRQVVLVDELQDTDPAQLALLKLLAGGGRDLVAVGDPDQSIYGFRGADVDGILRFADEFRTTGGDPAPVVALTTCRRSGPELLAATRRVATGLGHVPGAHRALVAADGLPPGAVRVDVLRSESQQAQHLAAVLREAHLVDGIPWRHMAVLLRSTVRSLAPIQRAFRAAGVPVVVAGEEVPLVEQPAVRPFLLLLECALDVRRLDEDAAVELVTSALGAADAMRLRRLRQELRRHELRLGGGRASGALLVEALDDPAVLNVLDGWAVQPARRVAELLAVARGAVGRAGATAEDVLWAVWSRSGLPASWERRSARGGSAGAAADRDLDAMVALFEMAATFADRMPGSGPGLFLEYVRAQEIPAETLAPRTPASEAVSILTAHAAKGLEWDVVCVAGVQEGTWPDVRMRGSFLGSERLVDIVGRGGADLPPAEASAVTLSRLLAEERRLFYVAVTRARKRLIVTAVESEREGLAPSRFLDELDPRPGADVAERRHLAEVARPISLVALVAELRQRLSDAETPDDLRTAAARHLAQLAAVGVRGADPSVWWGLTDLSDDSPVRRDGEIVTVSPSRVDAFLRCELRWFLEQAGGGSSPSTAQTVGTVVHAVAESAVDAASSTEAALLRRLDELLASADLGQGWAVTLETERARQMVVRLAQWLADNPRELVAAEVDVKTEVDGVAIRGQVDRLERDQDGRAVVVDFKTGSTRADQSELARNGQLGTYQLAVESGAFADDYGLTESGGAMLVQLGKAGLTGKAREQAQRALADDEQNPEWARDLLLTVSGGMAGSSFHAMANSLCPRCPTRVACPLHDPDTQATR